MGITPAPSEHVLPCILTHPCPWPVLHSGAQSPWRGWESEELRLGDGERRAHLAAREPEFRWPKATAPQKAQKGQGLSWAREAGGATRGLTFIHEVPRIEEEPVAVLVAGPQGECCCDLTLQVGQGGLPLHCMRHGEEPGCLPS